MGQKALGSLWLVGHKRPPHLLPNLLNVTRKG